jgi:dihydroorotate dehydrogenase electron transfer subunit
MSQAGGEVLEIWLEGDQVAGLIDCPVAIRPRPGQYLAARPLDGRMLSILPVNLFSGYAGTPVDEEPGKARPWVAAPGLPPDWIPGTRLELFGPHGSGFCLPTVSRLALAVFGDTPSRLLALAGPVLKMGGAVTLLTDLGVPAFLPPQIEVMPLSGWQESLAWADFLALDIPLAQLNRLSDPAFSPETLASIPGQVLLHTPMPGWGTADCGVCAVHTRKGWRLACKDGPVFDLRALEW